MIGHLVSYVLSAAIKDKIFLAYFLLVAVILSLSVFFGSSSLTEQDQFTVVFIAGALRMASVFTLLLFIVFYFRRSFENRDVDFLFSTPVSRYHYLMAHFTGFAALAFVIALISTLGVLFFRMDDPGAVAAWGISLFAELLTLSAVAMFFGVAMSSAVSAALCVSGFYVLARLIGDIIGLLKSSDMNAVIQMLAVVMKAISFFIPRLDLLGQTSWLVYGVEDFPVARLMLQIAVFLGLILSATYLDLRRRQF
jgi:hypothetical protein